MSVLLAAILAAVSPLHAERSVAGSVVRSKEWTVRRTPGHEEEQFDGDVRYESGDSRFSSDWALYRKSAQDWRARGHVALRRRLDSGAVIQAFGDAARFSERTREGRLDAEKDGMVSLRRDPPEGGEPDLGEGRALSWTGEESATLENAHVWGPRLELWADRAHYERAQDQLLLEGRRPVLVKLEGEWITALKADQIRGHHAPQRVEAAGRVRGWLVFKNEKELIKKASK